MYVSARRSSLATITCTAITAVSVAGSSPLILSTVQYHAAVAQIQIHDVQLRATTISSLASSSSFTALAELHQAEVTKDVQPSAALDDPYLMNDIGELLGYLAAAVGTLAISPLWYLGFPLTLPLSIGIGFLLDALPSWGLFPGAGGKLGPVGSALVGIGAYALLPVLTVATQLSLVASKLSLIQTVIANPSAASEPSHQATSLAAQAAATTEENPFETPLGQVLVALNFLALPLWFLAAPITLPLSMLAAASRLPDTDSPLNTLLFLAGTGIAFLTGPLGALSMLLQPDPTPAAAVRASAARSTDTAIEPNEEVASDVAPSTTQGGSDIRRKASASTPVRGRVTGLPDSEKPGSAAALPVKADQFIDAEADESAKVTDNDGTDPAEAPAARDGRGSAKANTGGRNR